MTTIEDGNVTFEGKTYSVELLPDAVKRNLYNIKFVDTRLLELRNEWAVSDTARIGYSRALKSELNKKS